MNALQIRLISLALFAVFCATLTYWVVTLTSHSGAPVPAAAVRATLRKAGGELLESVWLFDVYRGERLGAGRRSLAFRLRFRALDHTLGESELAGARQRAVEAVGAAHGGELRS